MQNGTPTSWGSTASTRRSSSPARGSTSTNRRLSTILRGQIFTTQRIILLVTVSGTDHHCRHLWQVQAGFLKTGFQTVLKDNNGNLLFAFSAMLSPESVVWNSYRGFCSATSNLTCQQFALSIDSDDGNIILSAPQRSAPVFCP